MRADSILHHSVLQVGVILVKPITHLCTNAAVRNLQHVCWVVISLCHLQGKGWI